MAEDTLTPADHDVLIELRTEMRLLRADIKDLKDTTGKVTGDHETRLRTIERFIDNMTGKYAVIAVLGAMVISVITTWIIRHI